MSSDLNNTLYTWLRIFLLGGLYLVIIVPLGLVYQLLLLFKSSVFPRRYLGRVKSLFAVKRD